MVTQTSNTSILRRMRLKGQDFKDSLSYVRIVTILTWRMLGELSPKEKKQNKIQLNSTELTVSKIVPKTIFINLSPRNLKTFQQLYFR